MSRFIHTFQCGEVGMQGTRRAVLPVPPCISYMPNRTPTGIATSVLCTLEEAVRLGINLSRTVRP